jgi:serine phosphatase RsbU (regulator of sigma subunit)
MKKWTDIKKKLSSIRWQITLRSWLVLIPCFAISNGIIYANGKMVMEKSLKERIAVTSELFNFSIQEWQEESENLLEIISKVESIQLAAEKQDRSYSSGFFKNLNNLSKYKLWMLRSKNGEIIDYTYNPNYNLGPFNRGVIKNKIFRDKNISKQLSFSFKKSIINGIDCMESSEPIFSRSINKNKKAIVGSISYCLDDKSLGLDSGLDNLYKTLNSELIYRIFGNISPLRRFYEHLYNMDPNRIKSITKFVIISKNGHMYFPTSNEIMFKNANHPSKNYTTIEAARKNGLHELIDFVKGPNGNFEKIQIYGTEYYAHNSSLGKTWDSVTLIKSQIFLKALGYILFCLIILQIFTMIIIGVCLNLQARQISDPIDIARLNIKQISKGIFDINIAHNRYDEIGDLYNDINLTAEQLRKFIKKITENAVTTRQLEIATKIQGSFLVENLPESNFYELAALFNPAYEIGADWYDAISINDQVYLIIADVCDKGIASALFMSVFRTLIRYTLLKYYSDLNSNCDEILVDVISSVNNYMAITHESATMFATVFIASYSHKNNSLSYVCAGHELPIIIRSDGLEYLKSTGPAIGLFPEAKFKVNEIGFYSGDVLFSYTDGLTDARSPINISWGIHNLEEAINAENHSSCSAQDLLTNIANKATKHIDTAEQFDDLTILVLKAKDGK